MIMLIFELHLSLEITDFQETGAKIKELAMLESITSNAAEGILAKLTLAYLYEEYYYPL